MNAVILIANHAGDKLYIGTSTGTVQMHTLGDEQGSSPKPPSTNAWTNGVLSGETGNSTLTETITVSKKPIEQLGYLKDVNSLVVLSGTLVLLFGSTITDKPQTWLSRFSPSLTFNLHHYSPRREPPSPSPSIHPFSISLQQESRRRYLSQLSYPTSLSHVEGSS